MTAPGTTLGIINRFVDVDFLVDLGLNFRTGYFTADGVLVMSPGAAALQFCLAHPRVAAIIPGGANLEQTLENKGLVDAAIPGGLWRGLKEAGCVRGDAPTPGNADGRL